MPYIHFSEQEKELAKQADIVRFLQVHGEQVMRTGKEFAWDSPAGKVTIRENQWYSQYEQTGGGAVKFLRKFFGMTYPEAVRSLLGESAGQEIRAAGKEKPKPEPKNFSPPPPHSDMRRLYAYLLNERGIDRDIIHAFTHEGLLYEDADNHNVCFVGKDDTGTVRHLHKRATNPLSDFKGNITGSDAEYAFHYTGKSDRLYVFEAPIDLLAFLTLYPAGWQEHSYVALCSTADRAALRMLKDHPQLKQVYLCLDHDSAGIEGAYRIADSIHSLGEYQVYRLFPEHKDWDEDLKERAGRDCIPSSEHSKLEYITDSCDDLSTCNVGLDPDLASFSRFPNDIVEDGLTKLKLLYRQNEPYTMAKVCLAICYYRDRMIGQEQDFSHYVRQMQAIYRPHRDTESAGLLGDNIRKQLFALEKELKKTGAVTAVEQNIQNRKLLTLGLDCLRLCGAMEREQTAEQAEPLALTM